MVQTHKLVRIVFLVLLFPVVGCATRGDIFPPTVKPVGIYHQVTKKETLWRISKTYGIPMEDIVRANRLPDASKINTGQFLFIPGAAEIREVAENNEFWKGEGDFIWPLKGRVISFYGAKKDNIVNNGIDVQGAGGTDIMASRSGKVVFCEQKVKGQGGIIIIEHGDDFSTVYGHSLEILVKAGQVVKSGMAIAKMREDNPVAPSYLHFEIRKGNTSQNPFHYLP